MNFIEKIFYKHSGKKVKVGDLIVVNIDICMGNDVTFPLAIKVFKKMGFEKVFDKDKVIACMDHFVPAKDIEAAKLYLESKKFALEQGLSHFIDIGNNGGIEHVVLPDQGYIKPGQIVIGADSHTCTYGALGLFSTGVGSSDLAFAMGTGKLWFKIPETIKIVFCGRLQEWVFSKDLILYALSHLGEAGAVYKAIEFSGNVISELSMDQRFTITNMAVEIGAKCGYILVDEKTREYLKERGVKNWEEIYPDKDAYYEKVYEFDVSYLEPYIAEPSSPANGKPISNLLGLKINQVYIGSCTNGRYEDFEVVAKVVKGKKVNPSIKAFIIPGSYKIYRKLIDTGIMKIFADSGFIISPPTCGACLGGHMGVLGPNEICVSTTNRNFVGRMGDRTSKVYLASPAVASASAIAGKIEHPENI